MRMFVAALAFAALAAPGGARDRNSIPEAVAAGKPQSCIPLYRIRQSHVRSDQVIDFDLGNGHYYRNTLPSPCPELGFEERFSYETSLSELCSTDIITVLHVSGPIRGPSCGLGEFQPVTLVKKPKR